MRSINRRLPGFLVGRKFVRFWIGDRQGRLFAEPAAQVHLAATMAAEGHGRSLA